MNVVTLQSFVFEDESMHSPSSYMYVNLEKAWLPSPAPTSRLINTTWITVDMFAIIRPMNVPLMYRFCLSRWYSIAHILRIDIVKVYFCTFDLPSY